VADPSLPWTDDVVIRNNRIADCWGEGIGLWYGSNAVVEGNVVQNAWNVGIYLDNSFNVRIERNYVHMTRGMNGNGGSGILMGSEVYDLASTATHHITIQNNVIQGGKGIGWWNASNSYGQVSVLHNTVVAGKGLSFYAASSGVAPTGCAAKNNVIAETTSSTIGNAGAWTLAGNAWLNRAKPAIAGASDVSLTVTVPTITTAADAQPLAARVGTGVASGVPTDYLCATRSTTAPVRGAFER
jgi:parallel beta-helix repeat protein